MQTLTASQPTVVISFMDGSLYAGGSRPTSTLARRCRKGAIHPSFDDLVCKGGQAGRYFESERVCALEVDGQVVFSGELYR